MTRLARAARLALQTLEANLKGRSYSAYLMQLRLVLLCVVTLLGRKRGHWLTKPAENEDVAWQQERPPEIPQNLCLRVCRGKRTRIGLLNLITTLCPPWPRRLPSFLRSLSWPDKLFCSDSYNEQRKASRSVLHVGLAFGSNDQTIWILSTWEYLQLCSLDFRPNITAFCLSEVRDRGYMEARR